MKLTPAQSIAHQIRSLTFNIKNNAKNTAAHVEGIMVNGFKSIDGQSDVPAADILAALGETDVATVSSIIAETKTFADSI